MIKQFVAQEFCLGCEGCCRFTEADTVWSPYLLDSDIQELLQNHIPPLTMTPNRRIRLIPHPQGEGNFTPLETITREGESLTGFICAFFDTADNKCKIYSYRPFECQLYPFLINRNLDKVFLAVDLRCPFIGEKTESKEFKEYVNELLRILNSPAFIKTLKNNPQAYQAYPAVLNLAELKV